MHVAICPSPRSPGHDKVSQSERVNAINTVRLYHRFLVILSTHSAVVNSNGYKQLVVQQRLFQRWVEPPANYSRGYACIRLLCSLNRTTQKTPCNPMIGIALVSLAATGRIVGLHFNDPPIFTNTCCSSDDFDHFCAYNDKGCSPAEQQSFDSCVDIVDPAKSFFSP